MTATAMTTTETLPGSHFPLGATVSARYELRRGLRCADGMLLCLFDGQAPRPRSRCGTTTPASGMSSCRGSGRAGLRIPGDGSLRSGPGGAL